MIPRSAVTLCAALLLAPVGSLACATSPSAEKPAAPVRIYVSNQLDNTVSVIDGATHKIVATVRVGVSPAQMAVSPDRQSVYIANTGSNTVSVLNTDYQHRREDHRAASPKQAYRYGPQPERALSLHRERGRPTASRSSTPGRGAS